MQQFCSALDLSLFDLYFPLWNFEKGKLPSSFIEEVSFDEETIFLSSLENKL